MKRSLLIGVVSVLLLTCWPVVVAARSNRILITEVQTGSATSASEEFIELYNDSADTYDISTWQLQTKATGATSQWTSRLTLNGLLYPGATYLIAREGYKNDIADATFSSNLLSASGGHVRLVRPDAGLPDAVEVFDTFGWGNSATSAETAPFMGLSDGKSAVRSADADGQFIDTNNNAQDFVINTAPVAESTNLAPETTETVPTETATPTPSPQVMPEPSPSATPVPDITPEAEAGAAAPVQITELMPDPAPPETDAQNEFVELYNPTDTAVPLKGYKLQTGTNFTYSFTFTTQVLAAHTYSAFYIPTTKLSLSNSAGRARLLGASGEVISQTDAYTEAPTGDAYILYEGGWLWTTTVTPNAANILTQKEIEIAASKTPAAKATKTTTKATKTPTPKSSTTAKSTVAKKTETKGASTEAAIDPSVQQSHLHGGVLAAGAIFTLGYICYEYRNDIRNRIWQFRKHRKAR